MLKVPLSATMATSWAAAWASISAKSAASIWAGISSSQTDAIELYLAKAVALHGRKEFGHRGPPQFTEYMPNFMVPTPRPVLSAAA